MARSDQTGPASLADWLRWSRRQPIVGYGAGVALPIGALAIRMALGSVLTGFPFLAYFAAVLLAALIGGRGPGLVASLLSALFADYFLVPPIGQLALEWPSGWLAMAFFAVTSVLIVLSVNGLAQANEARDSAEAALRQLNHELEARVAERTRQLEQEASERTKAEAQMRQMQKIEAIGQLTGGIAHDFNNMLAIIIGSLDILRRRLPDDFDPALARHIDHARSGADRAATLTARLLAFSRQQPLAPQPIDANKLLAGLTDLISRTIGDHIEVETVLGGGLWRAFADPAQLENAIINLAVNARDAMPQGGKLTLETANADLDERYARANPDVEPGHYVLLSVTDTGTGMSPEIRQRALDPFFTTKEVGKGTGLGLSQVFGYLKQSRGHLKIYSEEGIGTSIKLYLPRHIGAAAEAPAILAPGDDMPIGNGSQTILVIEDEAEVRAVTVSALGDLRYRVIEAESGATALAILASDRPIDMILTDIVMPGINGRELADRAAQLRPGIRIVFTTGYTRNAIVHNGILDHGIRLLSKPFTVDALARKVHEALSAPSA